MSPPKVARVADAVRAMIADGTLKPGDITPSTPALRRATGVCDDYCYRALRELTRAGVLVPGPKRQSRPRVAVSPLLTAARERPGLREGS